MEPSNALGYTYLYCSTIFGNFTCVLMVIDDNFISKYGVVHLNELLYKDDDVFIRKNQITQAKLIFVLLIWLSGSHSTILTHYIFYENNMVHRMFYGFHVIYAFIPCFFHLNCIFLNKILNADHQNLLSTKYMLFLCGFYSITMLCHSHDLL